MAIRAPNLVEKQAHKHKTMDNILMIYSGELKHDKIFGFFLVT